MDLLFLVYILLSAVLSAGGAFYFYSGGQGITAMLYLFGTIAALVYFGFRWFTAAGDLTSATATNWPPVINVCPDFLSLYKGPGATSAYICVDTIGVADQRAPTALRKFTPGSGEPTADQTFSLSVSSNDSDRITALCAESKNKGVKWEGVFDGITCLNNLPPAPADALVIPPVSNCAVNQYRDSATDTCMNCPTGKVSLAGSTRLEDCVCPAGKYAGTTGNCMPCPSSTPNSPRGSTSVSQCRV